MRRMIEIMWLAIAAVSCVEMFIGYGNGGFSNQHFQLFALIFVTAGFMFYIRKRQRKSIEKQKKG